MLNHRHCVMLGKVIMMYVVEADSILLTRMTWPSTFSSSTVQVTQLLSIQTKYIAVINASIPTASRPRLIQ